MGTIFVSPNLECEVTEVVGLDVCFAQIEQPHGDLLYGSLPLVAGGDSSIGYRSSVRSTHSICLGDSLPPSQTDA